MSGSTSSSDSVRNSHTPGTVAWITECKRLLAEPFPVSLIKEKNGLAYLPHEVVRERLIAATGNCFDWTIDQILFRDDGVTRRAKDRTSGETPRPISMVVVGRLMIPELGTRAGIGAHPLDAGAGEDAAYKSAESDALKRAAMAFGVGLAQLYLQADGAPQRMFRANERNRSDRSKSDQSWRSAWQARIDAVLAMPDATGKRAWQELVAEGLSARSADRLALLMASARSDEAAKAIADRAKSHDISLSH